MEKPWSDCKWIDFHKAAAIVIPKRYKSLWKGFYLPMRMGEQGVSDLELPDGNYSICTDFDFDHPRTDYDRACQALIGRTHNLVPAGSGAGLALAGLGPATYCSQAQLIVFQYGGLPALDRLEELPWKGELVWEPGDSHLTLMNACLHGADSQRREEDFIDFELELGRYSVTSAAQGNLFRFIRLA